MTNVRFADKGMTNCIRLKKWKSVLLGMLLVGVLVTFEGVMVEAATIDFKARIVELQKKFPDKKYWNKVGLLVDNSDGYTDKACSLHGDAGKAAGVDHVYNTNGCTCNHFAGGGHLSATQCMGFANKLAYDVFGETTWIKVNSPTTTQLASIKIGDIVRLDYNSHSVFVISRTGNKIMVGEANYGDHCQINWGRIIDLSTANVTYYEHAANYDTVIGSQNVEVGGLTPSTQEGTTGEASTSTEQQISESTTEATTEATSEAITTEAVTEEAITDEVATDFTGWKQTLDGEHYRYYKSGKLQKNKWLTIKKKKYYVDSKGYRVTGFYDIKEHTYYFDEDGVLKTKQWFSISDDTYYANEDGIILKSQWLYHKSTLVYVVADGSIAKSEIVKIGSKQYYFNSKGKRSKGFKKCKGKYYYCNSKGVIQKKKWVTKSGKKYYLQKSGVRAQSKLLKIGKYRYYFNAKGHMVKNKKVTYKDKIYKADKKGRCKYVADVETTEESPQDYTNSTEYTNEATTQAVSTIE